MPLEMFLSLYGQALLDNVWFADAGVEVQVRCPSDIQPEQFLRNNFASIVSITIMMFRRGCERD